MAKSLFDNTEPIPPTVEEIMKIHMIKKDKDVPSLLPKEDTVVNNNPYSDNPPQVFIDNKKIPEGIQASGSFFIRGEELFADMRIEFDVKNPKYSEYYNKLKKLIREAKEDHVLLSSSGI